ncbi:MAG: hypothetical protein CK428_24175 [Mycobacterium sp.]|nr:MAG: hypothetical protein CK428_24175 [Mycobacterium sp.]
MPNPNWPGWEVFAGAHLACCPYAGSLEACLPGDHIEVPRHRIKYDGTRCDTGERSHSLQQRFKLPAPHDDGDDLRDRRACPHHPIVLTAHRAVRHPVERPSFGVVESRDGHRLAVGKVHQHVELPQFGDCTRAAALTAGMLGDIDTDQRVTSPPRDPRAARDEERRPVSVEQHLHRVDDSPPPGCLRHVQPSPSVRRCGT